MGKKKKTRRNEITSARDVAAVLEIVRQTISHLNTSIQILRAGKLCESNYETANVLAIKSFIRLRQLLLRINTIFADNLRLGRLTVSTELRAILNEDELSEYSVTIINLPRITETLRRVVEEQVEKRLCKEMREAEKPLGL